MTPCALTSQFKGENKEKVRGREQNRSSHDKCSCENLLPAFSQRLPSPAYCYYDQLSNTLAKNAWNPTKSVIYKKINYAALVYSSSKHSNARLPWSLWGKEQCKHTYWSFTTAKAGSHPNAMTEDLIQSHLMEMLYSHTDNKIALYKIPFLIIPWEEHCSDKDHNLGTFKNMDLDGFFNQAFDISDGYTGHRNKSSA